MSFCWSGVCLLAVDGWIVDSKLFWKLKNEVVLLESSFISSSSFWNFLPIVRLFDFFSKFFLFFFFSSRDEQFFFLENYIDDTNQQSFFRFL